MVTMNPTLLILAAVIGVIPAIGKLVRAIMELLVRLVVGAFTVLFVILIVTAVLSRGKLM